MNKKRLFICMGVVLWIIIAMAIYFVPIGKARKSGNAKAEATRQLFKVQGMKQEELKATIAFIEGDEESKARDEERGQLSILLTYILVSITALYVVITWKILGTNREYNKISVRPLISTGLHRALNGSSLLTIKNIGLGPAKNLKVWVDGEEKTGFLAKEDREGVSGKKHFVNALAKEDSFILQLRGDWVAGMQFRVKIIFDSMFDENFAFEEIVEIPQY